MCCIDCFVVRGCAASRRYIDVCNCDMFSVVNVYLDHLMFCVLMVEGMTVVSNECNEPIPGGEVMYVGRLCFRGEVGILNWDDSGMCAVDKQFGIRSTPTYYATNK